MAGGKKSDLPVRTASAVVMVTVAGLALWLGGWFWAAFVTAVGLGVLWEWRSLVAGFQPSPIKRGLWNGVGIIYIAAGCLILATTRDDLEGAKGVLLLIAAVIGTDVGAYFAGRTIGGPKIAPSISPSKTWAGLFGGMAGSATAMAAINTIWLPSLCEFFYPRHGGNRVTFDGPCSGYIIGPPLPMVLVAGAVIAIVAQAGDFFESWMKRRAGVKDSGRLIPGHGGLFDRVDGLLAVSFVLGVLTLHSFVSPE